MSEPKRPTPPSHEAAIFENAMDRILRVSKDELKRREAAYRECRERGRRNGNDPQRVPRDTHNL